MNRPSWWRLGVCATIACGGGRLPPVAAGDSAATPEPRASRPNVPEDAPPLQSADGCPIQDPDCDGVFSSADRCPLRPETRNHFWDSDGCPDHPIIDEPEGRRVRMDAPLSFVPDTARLTPWARRQLKEVAAFLKNRAKPDPVQVVVYEFGGRGPWLALELSIKRAEEIRKTLVESLGAHFPVSMLGVGDYCSLSHPATAAHRPRVDILLSGPDVTSSWGCEASRRAGTVISPILEDAPSPPD